MSSRSKVSFVPDSAALPAFPLAESCPSRGIKPSLVFVAEDFSCSSAPLQIVLEPSGHWLLHKVRSGAHVPADLSYSVVLPTHAAQQGGPLALQVIALFNMQNDNTCCQGCHLASLCATQALPGAALFLSIHAPQRHAVQKRTSTHPWPSGHAQDRNNHLSCLQAQLRTCPHPVRAPSPPLLRGASSAGPRSASTIWRKKWSRPGPGSGCVPEKEWCGICRGVVSTKGRKCGAACRVRYLSAR